MIALLMAAALAGQPAGYWHVECLEVNASNPPTCGAWQKVFTPYPKPQPVCVDAPVDHAGDCLKWEEPPVLITSSAAPSVNFVTGTLPCVQDGDLLVCPR